MELNVGKVSICIFFVSFLILFAPVNGNAQMRIQYPDRFRFTGLVELTYSNYDVKLNSNGNTINTGTTTFEQYYRLGAEGFIYHPRLAVFHGSIYYRRVGFTPSIGRGLTSKDLGYDITATFLPYRPVSLDVYARRIHYTVDWTLTPASTDSNLYGAALRINTRTLPATRLEYYHFEYGILQFNGSSEVTKIDRYTLDMRGEFAKIRTRYRLSADIANYSRTTGNDTVQDYRLDTTTSLKNGILLSNYAGYSRDNLSKTLSFSSNLDFGYHERFTHYYGYEYIRTETKFLANEEQGISAKTTKSTMQDIWGSWGYMLTRKLGITLGLKYGLNKESENNHGFSWKSYGISSGIGYAWFWKGLNLSSHYRFYLRSDEKRGNSNENDFELNLITGKLKIGTLYANYAFYRLDATENIAQATGEDDFFSTGTTDILKTKALTTSQTFRIGIRGRLPGRLLSRTYWYVEGEYYNSDTRGTRQAPSSEFSAFSDFSDFNLTGPLENFENKRTLYTLRGNLSYAFMKGITIDLRGEYSRGKQSSISPTNPLFQSILNTEEENSVSTTRYFLEGRLNYPVRRSMALSAWLREMWIRQEGSPNMREGDLTLQAFYNRGQFFISFQGELRRYSDDRSSRLDRRIQLKISRII